MVCPRCGREQADAAECVACGIVVAKWTPERPERPAPAARVATARESCAPSGVELNVKALCLFVVSVSLSATVIRFLWYGVQEQGGGVMALAIFPLAAAFVVWTSIGEGIEDPAARRRVVWAGMGAIWIWFALLVPESVLVFLMAMAIMGPTGSDAPMMAKVYLVGSLVLVVAGLAITFLLSRRAVRNGGPAPHPLLAIVTPFVCLVASIGIPSQIAEHRRRAKEEWDRTRPARQDADLSDLQAQCDRGERQACFELGSDIRWNKYGRPRDPPRELRLFERACELAKPGEPQGPGTTGCVNAATMLREGTDLPADAAQSATLFERGCELGNWAACDGLGRALATGAGTARDAVRAAAVLTRACGAPKEAGFMADMPPSCARLGRMYLDGEGVARDEQQALALFELACFSRSGIGCYELGRLHLRGMGVARDTAKAEELFDKACALESQSASFDKGGCLLVEKECEVDAPRNCMAAAMAIRDDEARSAALHRRACAAGKAEACNWAARKYEFGATTSTASARPAPIDLRLARSLYERGCELDAKGPACAGALRMDDAACRDAPSAAERAGACLRAGRRHETATGGLVSQSLYLAAKSYEAACGLEPGGPGCAELERLCAWAPGAQKWMEVQGACPRRRP